MSKTLQEITDELTQKVKDRVENGETFYKTTCDSSSYGWSVDEHQAMHAIARAFRENGYHVQSNTAHGVTDWRIASKIHVNV